jgi:hypothetical protein
MFVDNVYVNENTNLPVYHYPRFGLANQDLHDYPKTKISLAYKTIQSKRGR